MGMEWIIIPLISTIVTAVVRVILTRTIGPTTPTLPPIMSGLIGTGIGWAEDLGVTVGLILGLAGIGIYEWWHTVIVPFVNGVTRGLKHQRKPEVDRDEGPSAVQ